MYNDWHSEILKPRKYLIFDGHKGDRRVFWNNEITIGDFTYRMIGVVKHSPGHFYGDVYDPVTSQWIHFYSMPESLERSKMGFTLEPLGDPRKGECESIEGLIPGSNYVHYIRIR